MFYYKYIDKKDNITLITYAQFHLYIWVNQITLYELNMENALTLALFAMNYCFLRHIDNHANSWASPLSIHPIM